jgi:hypothetical protein
MSNSPGEVAARFEVREVQYVASRGWALCTGNVLEGSARAGMRGRVAGGLDGDLGGGLDGNPREWPVAAVEYIGDLPRRRTVIALASEALDMADAQAWEALMPAGTVIELLG